MRVMLLPTMDRDDEMDLEFTPTGSFGDKYRDSGFLRSFRRFIVENGTEHMRVKEVDDASRPMRLVVRIKNDG